MHRCSLRDAPCTGACNGGFMFDLLGMAVTKLHDPVTWLGIVAFVAACTAGWYCGDIAFAVTEEFKGD